MFDGVTPDSVADFMLDIERQRKSMNPDEWRNHVSSDTALCKWRYLLSHDPYTKWGLIKPRGYAGDATLMDFAYKHPSVSQYVDNAGDLGKQIYKHTSSARQSKSARERTEHIASLISNICNKHSNVSIASFASGHGRELELLNKHTSDAISKFVAIDSDSDSLSTLNSVRGG